MDSSKPLAMRLHYFSRLASFHNHSYAAVEVTLEGLAKGTLDYLSHNKEILSDQEGKVDCQHVSVAITKMFTSPDLKVNLRGVANDRYYESRNTWILDVLADKMGGIPLSLSIIYAEVYERVVRMLGDGFKGRERDYSASALNAPGHVVARAGSLLIDVFNDCALVGEDQLLAQWYGGNSQNSRWHGDYNATLTPRGKGQLNDLLLQRCAMNLLNAFKREKEEAPDEHKATVDVQIAITCVLVMELNPGGGVAQVRELYESSTKRLWPREREKEEEK